MNYSKNSVLLILIWLITAFSLLANDVGETITGDDEIIVKGKGQSISDGDSKPSLKDSTDFGSADIDTGYVTRTYWIFYEGLGNLEITGNITSDDDAFTITSQPAEKAISSGDSIEFTVRFNPIVTDTVIATIVLS